jgi:hypothetical protein
MSHGNRFESFGDKTGALDGNIYRQETVHTFDKSLQREHTTRCKGRCHGSGMNTGVGSSGRAYLYPFFQQLFERILDDLLHRQSIWLHLPT